MVTKSDITKIIKYFETVKKRSLRRWNNHFFIAWILFPLVLLIINCGGGSSNESPTTICPTGQQLVGNTCQPITCPTGQQLVGNTCQPITTLNNPPIAFAGPDQYVLTGSIAALDGSGSYDPDNNPLTYNWGFTSVPNGSTAVISNSNAVNPTFTPNVSGNYVVRLIVNDGVAESGKAFNKDNQQEKTSEASYVTITAYTPPPPPPPTPTHVPTMEIVSVPSSVTRGGNYSITISYQDSGADISSVCFSEYVGGQTLYTGLCIAAGAWGIVGTSGSGTYSFTTSSTGALGVHNLEIWIVDSHGNPSIHRFYNLTWTCPTDQQQVGNLCQPAPSVGDNQLWKLESVESGYYRIVARHSGKVLDVEGGNTAPGTQVNQHTYTGGDHQRFSVQMWGSSGIYEIRVKQLGLGYSDLCLGVENNSMADYAKVKQQLCGRSSSPSQMWYFIYNSNGYYTIKNYNSGKCLDVVNASTADNANVQQLTCY